MHWGVRKSESPNEGKRDVFHMILYILMKWNVLSLVDSSEHFLFSFQLAKTFGSTTFVSVKYQCSSEFFQIGMPHFSLEGVNAYWCPKTMKRCPKPI